ncbi:ATP-binding protein [Roseateles asaccharophilus]|uniref:ATP-binding protein n=1 Tax=Roseateles asaccharophilus TaxID=582607 RepID=UPI00384DCBBF
MLTLLSSMMLAVSSIYVIWVIWRSGIARPPYVSLTVFFSSATCLIAKRWFQPRLLLDWFNFVIFCGFAYSSLHQDGLYASSLWWLIIPILFSLFAGSYWLGGGMAAGFAGVVWYAWFHGDVSVGAFSLTSADRSREQMLLAITLSTGVMLGFIGISQIWVRQLQRALQQALSFAEEALGARSMFMAKVGHEIRTPLNGMIAATELLKSGGHTESQQQQLMAIQVHSARMLLALVNDILDFSKIEAGSMTTEAREFSARRAVFQCIELFSVQAFNKGLDITCSRDASVPQMVIGDEHRVRQIITNLVSNAIKFTSAGGVHIHVGMGRATSLSDGMCTLRFEVSDSGIGIPGDKISTIFQAYNQVDSSVARIYGGTGLGLAISHELAKLMGGQLEVRSRTGLGSVFTLTLPFATPPASTVNAAPVPGKSDRAIVASQWRGLRRHMRSTMADIGLSVSTYKRMPTLDDVLQAKATVVMIDAALLDSSRDAHSQLEELSCEGVRVALIAPLGSDVMVGAAAVGVTLIYKPVRCSSVRDFVLGRKMDIATTTELAGGLAPESPTADNRWLHVLVAEDNPVNQIVVQAMLASMSCTAVIVATGQEAIQARDNEAFDAILMDIEMPVCDGIEATRKIRDHEATKRLPRVPIFALTGLGEAEDIAACLAAGMDRHLAKPFGINQLRAELNTLGKGIRR